MIKRQEKLLKVLRFKSTLDAFLEHYPWFIGTRIHERTLASITVFSSDADEKKIMSYIPLHFPGIKIKFYGGLHARDAFDCHSDRKILALERKMVKEKERVNSLFKELKIATCKLSEFLSCTLCVVRSARKGKEYVLEVQLSYPCDVTDNLFAIVPDTFNGFHVDVVYKN